MEYGDIVGLGNTATVYAWEADKVLKLFCQGHAQEAVEREFSNAMAIRDMDFAKPRAYEIISCENRFGIVYDRVEGEDLSSWTLQTGDLHQCAKILADLHRAIGRNRSDHVPDYKEFLRYYILSDAEDPKKQEEMLRLIDKFPEGNVLCHGDFHPGNVLISEGKAVVIDFMNLCRGDFLYDVARTVFLIEYTPVPRETKDKAMLLQLKKALAEEYLVQMEVSRDMIQDYLSVISVVRRGECPEEQQEV